MVISISQISTISNARSTIIESSAMQAITSHPLVKVHSLRRGQGLLVKSLKDSSAIDALMPFFERNGEAKPAEKMATSSGC